MPLKFNCQDCGENIIVKFLKVGGTAKCRACGAENVVPETAVETPEEPDCTKNNAKPEQPKHHPEESESVSGILEQSVPSGRRLHEMGFVDILDATFSLYRDHFRLFIGITAALHIPSYILTMFVTWAVPSATFHRLIITLVEGLFINPIVTGALIFAIAQEYLGQQTTIGEAFKRVRFWSILGASMLMGFACLAMAITCIGIPFAVYFGVSWSLFPQCIMVEGHRATAALRRSRALVRGFWWRVLGIELMLSILVFLIGVVPSFIMGLLIRFLQMGQIPIISIIVPIVALAMGIIATPITLTGKTLLYFDLRIRKEAFDIEMMARDIHGEA